jgi:hypothetical protein
MIKRAAAGVGKIIRQEDTLLVILLVLFMLIVRLLFMLTISSDGDNIYYWHSVKNLISHLPYEYSHHIPARYGIILPVYISQLLLGFNPFVYYVIPFLFSVIQIVIIYKAASMIGGRTVAVLSCILTTFFPQMLIQSGYNILPEIFETTYLIISVYLILLYTESDENRPVMLFWAAVFLFLGYLSKETMVFYCVPAAIYIYFRKKNFRHVLFFSALMAGFFLVELLIYRYGAGIPRGRIDILSQTHLNQTGMYLHKLDSFWQLFRRITTLPLYWKIPLLFSMAVSSFLLFSKNVKLRFLALLEIFFVLFMIFAIKGTHPIQAAFPFRPRYFASLIPVISIVTSYALVAGSLWLEKTSGIFERSRLKLPSFGYTAGLSVFLAVILAGAVVANSVTGYAPLKNHAIARTLTFHMLINKAYDNNMPIVIFSSRDRKESEKFGRYADSHNHPDDGNGGSHVVDNDEGRSAFDKKYILVLKGIFLIEYIYLDNYVRLGEDLRNLYGPRVYFHINRSRIDNMELYYISGNDAQINPDTRVMIMNTSPFSVSEGKISDLLQDVSKINFSAASGSGK